MAVKKRIIALPTTEARLSMRGDTFVLVCTKADEDDRYVEVHLTRDDIEELGESIQTWLSPPSPKPHFPPKFQP